MVADMHPIILPPLTNLLSIVLLENTHYRHDVWPNKSKCRLIKSYFCHFIIYHYDREGDWTSNASWHSSHLFKHVLVKTPCVIYNIASTPYMLQHWPLKLNNWSSSCGDKFDACPQHNTSSHLKWSSTHHKAIVVSQWHAFHHSVSTPG